MQARECNTTPVSSHDQVRGIFTMVPCISSTGVEGQLAAPFAWESELQGPPHGTGMAKLIRDVRAASKLSSKSLLLPRYNCQIFSAALPLSQPPHLSLSASQSVSSSGSQTPCSAARSLAALPMRIHEKIFLPSAAPVFQKG